MTTTLEAVPKLVRELPPEGQGLWTTEYNRDFAWRCSESHAEKAAWIAVRRRWRQRDDGWVER